MSKPLGKILTTFLLTAAVALLAAQRATAAEAPKPALTFAFAGYDQFHADLAVLDKLEPRLALSSKFEGLLSQATKGNGLAALDKSRPWGVLVAVGESDAPIIEGYLPITDLKKFMESVPGPNGDNFTPNDKGVYEITNEGRTIYAKQKGKWAIFSDNEDTLGTMPSEPASNLSDLTAKYLIAIRGDVQNVPQDRRNSVIAAIRGLAELSLATQGGNEEQQAIQRASAKQMFDKLEKLSKELDSIVIGLGMDAESKSLFLDIETRAVAGSDLAANFAAMKDAKTNFAGFALPGAALTVLASGKNDDETVSQSKEMLENVKSSAEKELDNNEELSDDKRATAKQLLNDAMDVLEKTIALKKSDGGAAIVLEDGPAVIAGSVIAEGDKLQATLKKLVKELATDKPALTNMIKLDAETYEGAKFNVMTIPVPDREAQAIFGETVEIVVGLSDSRIYIGAGKNAIELLKKAIAASKESPEKSIAPMEMVISVEAIAKFVSKIPERNPGDAQAKETAGKMLKQLAKTPGKDRVTLTMKPIDDGAALRLNVDSGVIKTMLELIGEASGGIDNPQEEK